MGLLDRLFRRRPSDGSEAEPDRRAQERQRRAEEQQRLREEQQREQERVNGLRPLSPDGYGVKKRRVHGSTIKVEFRQLDDAKVMDLRALPAAEYGIKGYSFHVEAGRVYQANTYRLVREPENPEDRWAIAVFNIERKVGYVSHAKAVQYAPLLDALPAEVFVVGGVVRERGKMLLLMPKLPELRQLVKRPAISASSA